MTLNRGQSIKKEIINEIHRNARVNFPTRKVEMIDIDHIHQADLVDMQNFKDENRGFRFILVVIDIMSKFVFAQPLKSKKAAEVAHAYRFILQRSNRIPKLFHVDQGGEFWGAKMKDLLDKYGIKLFNTFTKLKASIIERFIRTLKSKIYRNFHFQSSHDWVSVLQKLISEYNNTPHRTLKFLRPIDISKHDTPFLHANIYNYQKLGDRKFKFNIGDNVRISKNRLTFHKGYYPNFSTEIFKIIHRKNTFPPVYYIKDTNDQIIKGAFYEQELQKTKFPDIYLIEKILAKRKQHYLVRWLGFDAKHDSWILRKDIVR